MNADLQIPVSSLQYVKVPVSATSSGSPADPTTDPVQLAFVTVGSDPQSGDWVDGSWESGGTGIYLARALVGPGGDKTLTKGFYDVYVKVTDDPEIPVVGPRQIEVI